MCPDHIIEIGRLRVFASHEDDRSWRASTFTDSKIRSLRLALGRRRVAFTVTR